MTATAIVAALICIPYGLRVAYELCRPFIFVFYIFVFAIMTGGFALLCRWLRDWYF